jgi:hypothetical protein
MLSFGVRQRCPASLSKLKRRMDGRVKPGNDGMWATTRWVGKGAQRRAHAAVHGVGFAALSPPYKLNSFSALPWAMRSLSAALTGICSRKARACAIEP